MHSNHPMQDDIPSPQANALERPLRDKVLDLGIIIGTAITATAIIYCLLLMFLLIDCLVIVHFFPLLLWKLSPLIHLFYQPMMYFLLNPATWIMSHLGIAASSLPVFWEYSTLAFFSTFILFVVPPTTGMTLGYVFGILAEKLSNYWESLLLIIKPQNQAQTGVSSQASTPQLTTATILRASPPGKENKIGHQEEPVEPPTSPRIAERIERERHQKQQPSLTEALTVESSSALKEQQSESIPSLNAENNSRVMRPRAVSS